MSGAPLIELARRRGARLLATFALVLTLLAVPAEARAAGDPNDWLGRVNYIRLGSGLPAVSDNPSWSAGILAHLRYLQLTPDSYRTGAYASAHTENPASPYYTPEGAKEAESSDLTYGSSSNLDAINGWLTAPFHAFGMLRPQLEQVAFGREPVDGAAGLDVISGLTGSAPARDVLFPGPGTTIDLPRFGGESPTPIETCNAQHPGADYSSAGLPLFALLAEPPDPALSATLTQPDGQRVASSGSDLCVVMASNFVTTDSVYGPSGHAVLLSDNGVVVIPRTPLTKGTYTVDLAQPGRPNVTWSFLSEPPPQPADLSRMSTTCSWSRVASGRIKLQIGNPSPDGGGDVRYLVSLGGPQRALDLADGASGSVGIGRMRAGRQKLVVTGSDGTEATLTFTINRCPAHAAVRVRFSKAHAPYRSVGVRLDNSRNLGAVFFKLKSSGARTRVYRVAGGKRKRVRAPLRARGKTVVLVKAAGRSVARYAFRR